MHQGRNEGGRTMFTRLAISVFTLAASPTSRRHISHNTQPNSMILGLLESPGCLVSRECGFIAFGPAGQKLWAKEWRLSKTSLHFDI